MLAIPLSQAPRQAARLSLSWARHQDELRAAQRLRHQVFVQELGARLRPPPGTPAGHDADLFDAHCDHLLLREQFDDGELGDVVACYRLMGPAAARRLGGLYADTEFDLTRLRAERHRIAELGRACVHPAYRSGAALLMLWGGIFDYLRREKLDLLLGCTSVDARDGGSRAWALWNQVAASHMAPIAWQVRPRQPLHPAAAHPGPVEPPPLLRGYLKINAKLIGAPAWDGDFRTADFPMLLRQSDMPASYRRRFVG